MSWTGFKRGVDRFGTKIMMKAGQVERTVDAEFDLVEQEYRIVESAIEDMQSESRSFLQALEATTSAQSKIASSIKRLLQIADEAETAGVQKPSPDRTPEYYQSAISEFDEDVVQRLVEPYKMTVLEPASRFCAYFKNVNAAIKKREHKMLDHDAKRAKDAKNDKARDPVKMQQVEVEATEASEIYYAIHNQIMDELPQMLEMRFQYFEPTFESFMIISNRFCSSSFTKISQVDERMDPRVRDNYTNGSLDAVVDDALERMGQLTICSFGQE